MISDNRSEETEAAIIAAALDYYDGWFDAEPDRMERALHRGLVKRSLANDGLTLETLTARQMIDWTAEGVGKEEDPGERNIEIRVDHVYGAIATMTVTSAIYIDYLQLIDTPEGWKIVNVLWAPLSLEPVRL
jgi:Putative lumazine-binding